MCQMRIASSDDDAALVTGADDLRTDQRRHGLQPVSLPHLTWIEDTKYYTIMVHINSACNKPSSIQHTHTKDISYWTTYTQ